jgi:small-conductance mechanosensitive channel
MDVDFGIVFDQLAEIAADFLRLLPGLVVGLVVFIIFYYLARGIRLLVRRLLRASGRPENLGRVLGRLSRWLFIILGFLLALLIAFPGFSVGQLVQILGLGSLAAGIAFRSIFEDFVAGVLLLVNEPFRVGDQIVVGEYEGTIEDIQTRTTAIETYDRRRVIIPNADLLTDAVVVNTAYAYRRIEYDVGVGYSDDVEVARRLILEAIDGVSGILKSPAPDVVVMELADSAVILRTRWWVEPPRRVSAVDTRDRVLQAIKTHLQAHGIDLPFPTRQVLFHDQTEEGDGDRTRQREGWPAGPGAAPRPQRVVDVLVQLQRNSNATTKLKGNSNSARRG